ncbi:MAG: hypothetical protein WCA49_17385 [Candidatus Sulfotelmatobacter sp.]
MVCFTLTVRPFAGSFPGMDKEAGIFTEEYRGVHAVGCGLGSGDHTGFGAVVRLDDPAEFVALLVTHLADHDVLEFARSQV